MKLYDYEKILTNFDHILEENYSKAILKKVEYLDKIVMIFRQFLHKCEKEIDHIIHMKI